MSLKKGSSGPFFEANARHGSRAGSAPQGCVPTKKLVDPSGGERPARKPGRIGPTGMCTDEEVGGSLRRRTPGTEAGPDRPHRDVYRRRSWWIPQEANARHGSRAGSAPQGCVPTKKLVDPSGGERPARKPGRIGPTGMCTDEEVGGSLRRRTPGTEAGPDRPHRDVYRRRSWWIPQEANARHGSRAGSAPQGCVPTKKLVDPSGGERPARVSQNRQPSSEWPPRRTAGSAPQGCVPTKKLVDPSGGECPARVSRNRQPSSEWLPRRTAGSALQGSMPSNSFR